MEEAMRLLKRRLNPIAFVLFVALLAVLALAFTLTADSAVGHRWADKPMTGPSQ
jgi:hypothetical protein